MQWKGILAATIFFLFAKRQPILEPFITTPCLHHSFAWITLRSWIRKQVGARKFLAFFRREKFIKRIMKNGFCFAHENAWASVNLETDYCYKILVVTSEPGNLFHKPRFSCFFTIPHAAGFPYGIRCSILQISQCLIICPKYESSSIFTAFIISLSFLSLRYHFLLPNSVFLLILKIRSIFLGSIIS